jgi:hypothetical protein
MTMKGLIISKFYFFAKPCKNSFLGIFQREAKKYAQKRMVDEFGSLVGQWVTSNRQHNFTMQFAFF